MLRWLLNWVPAMNNKVYIHAASAVDPQLNSDASARQPLAGIPEKKDATEIVKSLIGDPLRQASHLVKMGVIGVMHCRRQIKTAINNNAAIYVGTGLGEMDKCRSLFEQVMPPGNGMASPFDFISSSSNIASFYAAKILGLSTHNITISQDELSFEYALKLAVDDILAGSCRQAMVGGIDERSTVTDYQLRRMHIRDDQILGEGCGWLFLDSNKDGALACIGDVLFLDTEGLSETEWIALIKEHLHDTKTILPGFRLTDEACSLLQEVADVKHYLQHSGCYHTASAFGIADALLRNTGRPFAHINITPEGRTAIIKIT